MIKKESREHEEEVDKNPPSWCDQSDGQYDVLRISSLCKKLWGLNIITEQYSQSDG